MQVACESLRSRRRHEFACGLLRSRRSEQRLRERVKFRILRRQLSHAVARRIQQRCERRVVGLLHAVEQHRRRQAICGAGGRCACLLSRVVGECAELSSEQRAGGGEGVRHGGVHVRGRRRRRRHTRSKKAGRKQAWRIGVLGMGCRRRRQEKLGTDCFGVSPSVPPHVSRLNWGFRRTPREFGVSSTLHSRYLNSIRCRTRAADLDAKHTCTAIAPHRYAPCMRNRLVDADRGTPPPRAG